MQKWEYTRITRNRGWKAREEGKAWHDATDWAPTWAEMEQQLQQLGDEGWELVAVVPRSGYLGGYFAAGTSDYAGFTDQELWVFKRPKQE